MSTTTSVSSEASEVPQAGVIRNSADRVCAAVDSVIDRPRKVAQDKYEQFKSEYPGTAPHLEAVEKKISDMSTTAQRNVDSFFRSSDDVLKQRVITPMENVRASAEREAETEEVRNVRRAGSEVRNAGHVFWFSLVTLVTTYATKLFTFVDVLVDPFIPPPEVTKTLIAEPTKPNKQATMKHFVTYSVISKINRVYGFLLLKSTVSGARIEFSRGRTLHANSTALVRFVVLMALGLSRYVAEKVLEFVQISPFREILYGYLSYTDFSQVKTSNTDKTPIATN